MGTHITVIEPLTGRVRTGNFHGTPLDRNVHVVKMSGDVLYSGGSEAEAVLIAARTGAAIQRDVAAEKLKMEGES